MACEIITTLANACAANIADLQTNLAALKAVAKNICDASQPPTGDITQTLLLNFNSRNVAATYSTQPLAPSQNALLLAFVVSGCDLLPPTVPTISGCGVVWSQVQTLAFGSSNPRLTVFKALGFPAVGTLAADFAGQNQDGCQIAVVQFTNVNQTGVGGAGAIAQVVLAGPTTGAVASMSLAPLDASGKNACVFIAARSGNPFSGVPAAGWANILDTGISSKAHNTGYGYWLGSRLATTDNNPAVACPFTSWIAMGIEIKAS